MKLENWDKISPILGSIDANAAWVKVYAEHMKYTVNSLPYRPRWETEAHGKLVEAIQIIEKTLAMLKELDKAYAAKPVKE